MNRQKLNYIITLPKDLRGQSSGQKNKTENTQSTNKRGPGLEYVREEAVDTA